MPPENSNNPQNPENEKCFFEREIFWFLLFCVAISGYTFWKMERANDALKSSHELILNHENSIHTEIRDSLLSFCKSALADSTLSNSQRQAIQYQIDASLNKADKDLNSEKIGNLLELEFAKIQNEYEVLNLWCALMTVVFLIFSFFSIFKTGEMNKQGEESLKSLRATEYVAKEKSASIDEKVTQAEARITEKETELIEKVNEKIKTLTEDINKNSSELESLEKKISDSSEVLQKLEEEKAKALTSISDKVNDEEASLSVKISQVVGREVSAQLSKQEKSHSKLIEDVNRLEKDILLIMGQLKVADPSQKEVEDADDEEDIDSHEEEPHEEDPDSSNP